MSTARITARLVYLEMRKVKNIPAEDALIFRPIHSLLKRNRYDDVLNLLYDKKTNRLRQPYTVDRNHAWYIIGDVFYKKGRLIDAIMAFRRSLRFYKKDGQALWALGNSYSTIGRAVLAERYFRKGLVLASETDRPKLVYNLGNALFDQEKYVDAIKEYQKIYKHDRRMFSLARRNIENASKKIEETKRPTRRKTTS